MSYIEFAEMLEDGALRYMQSAISFHNRGDIKEAAKACRKANLAYERAQELRDKL